MGSVTTIADATGAPKQRFSYSAFGQSFMYIKKSIYIFLIGLLIVSFFYRPVYHRLGYFKSNPAQVEDVTICLDFFPETQFLYFYYCSTEIWNARFKLEKENGSSNIINSLWIDTIIVDGQEYPFGEKWDWDPEKSEFISPTKTRSNIEIKSRGDMSIRIKGYILTKEGRESFEKAMEFHYVEDTGFRIHLYS